MSGLFGYILSCLMRVLCLGFFVAWAMGSVYLANHGYPFLGFISGSWCLATGFAALFVWLD